MWGEIIGLLLGLLLGGVGVWYWLQGRQASTSSVEALKQENQRFRKEVNEHFVQTAELINQLTDSYKAVFDHLSDGAERLVDQETRRDRMPRVGNQEIRLKRIGTRDADQSTQTRAGADKPKR